MDDCPQRGRGADARVLVDQGAQPAVQHPPARRQELPVPRRDRRRAVAAGDGDARPQAQGDPLLRPVRPRLRHPRHPRRAAALVPDPHLQPGEVPPARAARPARACCTTSRSAPGRASARSRRCRTASWSPSCATSSRATPSRSSSASTPRCARPRRRWSSRRRPGCATGCSRCGGRSSASRWWPTRPRTSTSSASPATSWRRRCRCSTCARAGSSAARGWSSTRSRS